MSPEGVDSRLKAEGDSFFDGASVGTGQQVLSREQQR